MVTGCHQFGIFPEILGIIIPIDEVIFFRGVAKNHQPVIRELYVMSMATPTNGGCELVWFKNAGSLEHPVNGPIDMMCLSTKTLDIPMSQPKKLQQESQHWG